MTEEFFKEIDIDKELLKHYRRVVLIEVPRRDENNAKRYYDAVSFMIKTINNLFDERLKTRKKYSPFIWGSLVHHIANHRFHSNQSLKVLTVLKQILLEVKKKFFSFDLFGFFDVFFFFLI